MTGLEAERQGLAAEVQRLTDALHEQKLAAERAASQAPAKSPHDEDTVIGPPPTAANKNAARDAIGAAN